MRKPLLLSLLLLASCTLQARIAEAIFAGGNFWRLEADFNSLPGVLATVTGFDGGNTPNPTYEQVNSGKTGYTQAVRVIYNPDQISYKNLLRFYWHRIDPTEKNGQFCDAGHQYKSAIFYLNDKQKKQHLKAEMNLKINFLSFLLIFCQPHSFMLHQENISLSIKNIRFVIDGIYIAVHRKTGFNSYGAENINILLIFNL